MMLSLNRTNLDLSENIKFVYEYQQIFDTENYRQYSRNEFEVSAYNANKAHVVLWSA